MILFYIISAVQVLGTRIPPIEVPNPRDYKVTQLSFMTGSWEGKLQTATLEETWLPPKASSLLGMMREEVNGKTAIREFEVIEETPEGIFMTINHFDSKLVPLADRKLSRKLISVNNSEAVFESITEPKQKIIYKKSGTNGLIAIVEIARNGTPVRLEIAMERKK
mgnify:CR=1 FL=1